MKKSLVLFIALIATFVATSAFAATSAATPAASTTSIKLEVNPEVANEFVAGNVRWSDISFGTPNRIAPGQTENTPTRRLPNTDGDISFGTPSRIAPGQAANKPVKGAPPVTFQIAVPDCDRDQVADGVPQVMHFTAADAVIYVTNCPDGVGACAYTYWKDPVFGTYWTDIRNARKDTANQLVYDTAVDCLETQ